jgi:hypothetical protein
LISYLIDKSKTDDLSASPGCTSDQIVEFRDPWKGYTVFRGPDEYYRFEVLEYTLEPGRLRYRLSHKGYDRLRDSFAWGNDYEAERQRAGEFPFSFDTQVNGTSAGVGDILAAKNDLAPGGK